MPGSHCANFARRRTLLLVLCNLLCASTYEYGAPQELTREQLVALASAEIGLTALAAGHGRETGAPMTVTVYAQLD